MHARLIYIYADLTNSFQRSFGKSKSDPSYEDKMVPLWKKVDKRFWWNEYISRDLVTQKVRAWDYHMYK